MISLRDVFQIQHAPTIQNRVKDLVLTGAGRAFSAGGDLKAWPSVSAPPRTSGMA